MSPKRTLPLALVAVLLVSACDPGPNGYGTAPPGISQADWDAQVAARRQAKWEYMSGPRPGGAGGR